MREKAEILRRRLEEIVRYVEESPFTYAGPAPKEVQAAIDDVRERYYGANASGLAPLGAHI